MMSFGARGCLCLLLSCGIATLGCSQGKQQTPPPPPGLTRAQLIDPQTCVSCHGDHYRDWAASMHAHASDDPVFVAMNARGQRETNGELGTFCVGCHAPMAVRDGMTQDGTNLASLGAAYRGVTCFFCHSISAVDGSHNATVSIASDLVMRAEYADPVANPAHKSTYSSLHDDSKAESASACGACHDIVVHGFGQNAGVTSDGGAPIERTFAEWQASAFAPTNGGAATTCAASGCHMQRSETQVVIAHTSTNDRKRYFHHHDFPAVDIDLRPQAEPPDASTAVQSVLAKLADSVQGDLCVTEAGGVRVVLDAVAVGHSFPSGASQDRRLWIEINAYGGMSSTPYYSSGRVPAGGSPAEVDAQADPDMWLLRDCMFGADSGEVHMFWQAVSTEGNALPALSLDPMATSHRVKFFPNSESPLPAIPDRVTLNLWLQPIGLDVLNELVATHDLDPGVVAAMPTFPVPLGQGPQQQQLVWTRQAAATSGIPSYPDAVDRTLVSCVGTLPNPAVQAPATRLRRCSP
jgi:hypothetical protein